MSPHRFTKNSPCFATDFAPYLNLIRLSQKPTPDQVMKTFQASTSGLGRAPQLVICGLIITFPSVMSAQVAQLPVSLRKVVEHCEANSNTVEVSYVKEVYRLLRRLSFELNRHILKLSLADARADRAGDYLKPAFDQISESALNNWMERVLKVLSMKAPRFAHVQRDAIQQNQDVFAENTESSYQESHELPTQAVI